MSSRISIITAALVCALCSISQTRADPPHAAVNHHKWVVAGVWDDNTLLVRRNSIKRSGHIYDVIYSDNGDQDSDGIWDPAGNLIHQKIDCKYHTSHDVWIRAWDGSEVGERAGRWDAIKPDSEEAVIENYLCASARKGERLAPRSPRRRSG
jgi:hypothetical protein